MSRNKYELKIAIICVYRLSTVVLHHLRSATRMRTEQSTVGISQELALLRSVARASYRKHQAHSYEVWHLASVQSKCVVPFENVSSRSVVTLRLGRTVEKRL